MDTVVNISILPIEVLAHIITFVSNKENLFLVNKKFYEAACIASQPCYEISLHGNFEIRENFDDIITSNRLFDGLTITDLNLQKFSSNDIKKFLEILHKFGVCVKHLSIIECKRITEEDVRHVLSFFTNIKTFSIRSKSVKRGISVLNHENQPFRLASLESISCNSNTLWIDEIFKNVQLTDKFKSLDVTVSKLSSCFTLLEMNCSIKDLALTSYQSTVSIPISHLTLKTLILNLPKSMQLLPFLKQQTSLQILYLDDDKLPDYEHDYDAMSDDGNDEDVDDIVDVYLLKAVSTMTNLIELRFCIDKISDRDFVHFSNLAKLQELCITSYDLNKIIKYSRISVPSVTRLLLYFNVFIPKYILINIANNFHNVSELTYCNDQVFPAFFCFVEKLRSLKTLSMTTNGNPYNYLEFNDTFTIVCSTLKSVSLRGERIGEQHMDNFLIQLVLASPNVENFSFGFLSMKNLIYILRHLRNLKNVKVSCDLYSEERAKNSELEIIQILKEFGTKLNFVKLSLISPNLFNEDLWKQSFHKQFAVIEIEDIFITMKKDDLDEWNVFA